MGKTSEQTQEAASAGDEEEQTYPTGLIMEPAYRGVPKRYEDSKPFNTQFLTHRSILEIGSDFHKKLMEELVAEKDAAIRAREAELEAEAAATLRAEVERVQSYAAADRERALNQQKLFYEQQMREERMAVESQLTQFWEVKLEEAREEAGMEMRKAVERARADCMAQIDQVVTAARKEERKKAQEEMIQAQKATDERLRKEREAAMKDKEGAMARMKALLQEEKDTAVAAARIQEQNMAASELAAIISAQAEKLLEVEAEVKAQQEIVVEKDNQLEKEVSDRHGVMRELNEQKLHLAHLVDHVPHFVRGENEHLVDKRGTKDYIPDVTPVIEGTDF